MYRVLSLIGATVGGWFGWWLGSPVGIMTSFILSVIGTGFGVYIANRLARYYLG